MSVIKAFMLSSKSWQLFVVLCVVPFVAMFVTMFSRSLSTSAIVMIGFSLLLQMWFYSLGSFLNSMVDVRLRLSPTKFSLAALYPVLYTPVFFWFFFRPGLPNLELIVPLHLLAMFCMFYVIYFVAKALALVECRRTVSFSDYLPTFLLLWVYPVGVWIVQPRINRLYQSRSQDVITTVS